MSQARKKAYNYGNINEDDGSVAVGLRGRRKSRRRRSLAWVLFGLFIVALSGLVTVGVLAVFGVFGDAGESDNETACGMASVRVNCVPEGGRAETEDVCTERGCCWAKEEKPSCFYPDGFGYAVDGEPADTPTGMTVNATRKTDQPSQYGEDIETIGVDFYYETPYRLRVKVSMFFFLLHPYLQNTGEHLD